MAQVTITNDVIHPGVSMRQAGCLSYCRCSRSQNQGTVLSRAAVDRNLRGTLVRKGQPVGCTVCH